jgi:hypothetical protein
MRNTIMLCRLQAVPHRVENSQEQCGGDHQVAALAEGAHEQRGHRDHHDLGAQVGGRDPRALFLGRRQRAEDVAQRGVGDLDVEHRHEGAEHAGGHRDPGARIDVRTVGRGARRAVVRRRPGLARRGLMTVLTAPRRCGRLLLRAFFFLAQVDLDHRRHARHQAARVLLEVFRLEGDLDRHALDDLGEVAGRVIGRQQRELVARGRREAVHAADQFPVLQGVDFDPDFLARHQARQLGFLEVGGHPHVVLHDGGQLLARLDAGADFDAALADAADTGATIWL